MQPLGSANGQEQDETALIRGAQNFTAFARDNLNPATTIHHGYMPEIEITSPTTAQGVWAMEDIIHWPAALSSPGKTVCGYGHYHETYECIDGRWLIKTMKLTACTSMLPTYLETFPVIDNHASNTTVLRVYGRSWSDDGAR
jgi:SnoaL-like domain